MNRDFEKGISDIVGVFTDPIIVWPSPWKEDIPDWIKHRITLDRLVMNMRALHGDEMTATDSEALAYMFPLTLERPIDRDWTQIYLYLGSKVCPLEGKEMPDDIKVESLNDDQVRDLNRLKDWIYQKRIQVRLDRERAGRRQKKEEEAAEKKAAQPALFDF